MRRHSHMNLTLPALRMGDGHDFHWNFDARVVMVKQVLGVLEGVGRERQRWKDFWAEDLVRR